MAMTETKIGQGALKGILCDGYTVFQGIPYAAPPTGKLRFSQPAPPQSWQGVLEAKTAASACWQVLGVSGDFYHKEFYSDKEFDPELTEDCLKLDIWTPAEREGEGLPVAVWIHGGGFGWGFSREKEFSGKEYCKRGIVFVAINYRLGPLGFLAHRELALRSGEKASGNYGLLDQIAALRWIQHNISAFGGDAGCVTIFGQSAGAMSAQVLCSSPLARGLFHRAILQSGGGYDIGMKRCITREEAENEGERLFNYLGVKSVSEVLEMDARQLSNSAYDFFHEANPDILFYPNIDGWVFPASYEDIIDEGKLAPVPYMIGSTDNDFDARGDDPRPLHAGAKAFAEKLKSKGQGPVYVYYFKRQLPGDDAGAFHSAELWYMFGTLDKCWRPMTEGDRTLSRRMLDTWAAFMKSGSPATAETPWRPYSEGEYVQDFDVI